MTDKNHPELPEDGIPVTIENIDGAVGTVMKFEDMPLEMLADYINISKVARSIFQRKLEEDDETEKDQ